MHGGKVRELSKSTKRIQSLALDKMQGFVSGEVRLEVFFREETKEAEMCGSAGEVTSCLLIGRGNYSFEIWEDSFEDIIMPPGVSIIFQGNVATI